MTHPDLSRIAAIRHDLAGPRQDIEQGFVSVGARLGEGGAMPNTLSKLFEALPAALQGREVEEAMAHLDAVATRAGTLSATFAQEKADLDRLMDVVAAAKAPISDLRRTVKMIGIVSVNARVTAAGIVGDSDDFEVFTKDIATLSDSAGRTIQDFAQVYQQLTGEVDRAASQRARFETAHAQTMGTLAQSLSRTIAALAEQRAASLDSSTETGRVSRQIAGRIGSAVMALQIGDATRQRIEHVEHGLEVLSNLLTSDSDNRDDALAAISALQHAQLSETASSFLNDIKEAGDALADLASDAASIMARSRDFHGGSGGNDSVLGELNAQLRAATALLEDFEAERQKLETVASAVQETVRVLLEHVEAVQETEYNMRLVSLNAAIRCAQLGPRGAPLTVIATQLRELTSETVVAAEAAMVQLDQSSTLAGAFAASGSSGDGVDTLEQQANLALDILSELDRHLAAALGKLNTDGPKVIAHLHAAAIGLSGQSEMAETLDDIALSIAALSDRPAPQAISPDLSDVLEGIRKSYTMEAERLVHASLFGQAMAAATANENAPPADDLADFML